MSKTYFFRYHQCEVSNFRLTLNPPLLTKSENYYIFKIGNLKTFLTNLNSCIQKCQDRAIYKRCYTVFEFDRLNDYLHETSLTRVQIMHFFQIAHNLCGSEREISDPYLDELLLQAYFRRVREWFPQFACELARPVVR